MHLLSDTITCTCYDIIIILLAMFLIYLSCFIDPLFYFVSYSLNPLIISYTTRIVCSVGIIYSRIRMLFLLYFLRIFLLSPVFCRWTTLLSCFSHLRIIFSLFQIVITAFFSIHLLHCSIVTDASYLFLLF